MKNLISIIIIWGLASSVSGCFTAAVAAAGAGGGYIYKEDKDKKDHNTSTTTHTETTTHDDGNTESQVKDSTTTN